MAGNFPYSIRKVLLTVLTTGLMLIPILAAGQAPVISHQVDILLGVENHTVRITDNLGIPAGLETLRLGAGMTIDSIEGPAGSIPTDQAVAAAEDEDGPFQALDLKSLGLAETGGTLTIVYGGTFHEPVDEVVFSRENVGNEITATIGDEGIYLSSMAEWLPWAENTLATFDLSIDTPAGFETVTQGQRTEHTESDGRLNTRWVAANPSDGVNLIANRYFVHEEPVREGVVSYTFFLEDDARLRATYMERTKAYIAMYEEMIGPYPYTKFATVENWFPTGYGMPSYTLLGGQVLRLPFIPYTSFGHEIAHNWWGNSVYVDVEQGNWCEGLTVYCADYHYKELEGEEGAREYRRTLLKNYEAYVKDPSSDFPLSEFLSRHSGATRAVGYGKSMMVFHMVDRVIGRENFLTGLRQVAADHNYTKADWTDFMNAFAKAGDLDLTRFQEQWLTWTGAPKLDLGQVDFQDDKVVFTLDQGETEYHLDVPVVVTTKEGAEERVVILDGPSAEFEIEAAGITGLAVDPDCHLFRHLHPEEIEPTISQILGEENPGFVTDGAAPDMVAAARNFAAGFAEKDDYPFSEDGSAPADCGATVVINPGSALLKTYLPQELVVSGSTAFLEGKRYSLKENDLVFAAQDPDDPSLTHLVILCDSTHRLEAMARRVVHYGKYSWLMMPVGQGRPLRGNWKGGVSPLTAAR
ncbi:MAG: M1 family aminopeptidase [Candidatus Krumholzibacteriota bacterium]